MTKQAALEDFTAYLKAKLETDPERGVLSLHGERYFLAVPETLVGVQKELEELMGTAARAPVYAAGERAARASADLIRGSLARDAFPSEEAAIHYLAQIWSALGYGRVAVTRLDVGASRVDIAVTNSLVAEAHGPADSPVCHWYAGFAAGLFASLFDEEVHCHEMACVAAGADRCEFELAPVEYFLTLGRERKTGKA